MEKDDVLKRLKMIYNQKYLEMYEAKKALLDHMYETAVNTVDINMFGLYLKLLSDGDIYFECEPDSSDPHINVGYTAGPEYKLLDQDLQEQIVTFCSKLPDCDVIVDFNQEPELTEGRATYMFQ
jgi:hypothetical protein